MSDLAPYQQIDYLMIGHLTKDLTPGGPQIGGTAAYSSLTANALGLRTGIVTSWAEDLPLGKLSALQIVNLRCDSSTTFKNIETDGGRVQTISSIANGIHYDQVPPVWRNPKIIHIGPVAGEIDVDILDSFSSGLIGLTPQGWMRRRKDNGIVEHITWLPEKSILEKTGAIVVSQDELVDSASWIDEVCAYCRVLAVTEGRDGVKVYWNRDVRRFRPPEVEVVDTTGAGDIFAAAFFIRLYLTRDPWEAARFATRLSAYSVSRYALDSIPTVTEVQESILEVF